MQQTGETRDAIIESNNKILEDIINANKERKEKYWIVIFAKPAKGHVDGLPTLTQFIKPYNKKPTSKVGQILAEVDNVKGTVVWEINMPDVPFAYEYLPGGKHISGGHTIIETTKIGSSYVL
jgi:hypothetical protein